MIWGLVWLDVGLDTPDLRHVDHRSRDVLYSSLYVDTSPRASELRLGFDLDRARTVCASGRAQCHRGIVWSRPGRGCTVLTVSRGLIRLAGGKLASDVHVGTSGVDTCSLGTNKSAQSA